MRKSTTPMRFVVDVYHHGMWRAQIMNGKEYATRAEADAARDERLKYIAAKHPRSQDQWEIIVSPSPEWVREQRIARGEIKQ